MVDGAGAATDDDDEDDEDEDEDEEVDEIGGAVDDGTGGSECVGLGMGRSGRRAKPISRKVTLK
jgi:hypothetical protein